MRRINLSRLWSYLFAALLLFLAGFAALSLLDLAVAGIVLFVGALMFVTLALTSENQRQE